jgi:hypothetical protein
MDLLPVLQLQTSQIQSQADPINLRDAQVAKRHQERFNFGRSPVR